MASAELDVETVCKVISDAARMGYQVVSVSGGEPLMYGGLGDVLAYARSLNLRTTVTTNGFFIGSDRLARVCKWVDVLAVSLDGPPEIHNAIRGSLHAFKRLEAGLEAVRKTGIQFGFIHTLTQQNWKHLLWVAEFAASNGARLLQIHPLELAGRAGSQMASEASASDVLEKVYVLAFALANKYADTMRVQLDLLYRDDLREEPGLVYAGEQDNDCDQTIPAQLLGLLVLEPDGSVVPVSYGFSRRYKICNVKEQRLFNAWPDYVENGYTEFRALCRRVWGDLCASDAPLLTNWHGVITSQSYADDYELKQITSHTLTDNGSVTPKG